jgi:hypothetical protein
MEDKSSTRLRASTLEELENVFDLLFTEESYQRGLAFKPLPNDIIISPYAKSGTTWMQQIAHGLRTRGSMDFDEITEVTPWIEIAHTMGWDLDAPQVAEPRLFKSHLNWTNVPKGARYINVIRNPSDVMVSFYRFMEGWWIEPGSISLDTLTRWRWPRDKMGEQGYWQHLLSWWQQRHNENVLLLCYEDMKVDLPQAVRQVARFMEIELDQALLKKIVHQSSREFMLAHRNQFDESYMRRHGEERAGLPPGGDSMKVTAGTPDRNRYKISAELNQELDDIWREQIGDKLGFLDYDELRLALKET